MSGRLLTMSRLVAAALLASSGLGGATAWAIDPPASQGVDFGSATGPADAAPTPSLEDPKLGVRPVVAGLTTPTTMAFIGPHDLLVLEKNTGRVQRVTDGRIVGPVLSLPVNFFSERGLLGIALHPDFPGNPGVYLYWSQSASGRLSGDPADVLLLGNRVDRFVWDGGKLSFESNLIRLRAFQVDPPGQPIRGNHDCGVLAFEPKGVDNNQGPHHNPGDGKAKLLVCIGDVGRRGQMQNLKDGPYGPGIPDDQFGGPEPDNAHLTGAILRLNDDGSTPEDNPFFKVGARIGGEVGANIQKLFVYGVRNSFGLRFDPKAGGLWLEENGSDSFDKLSRVEPGDNDGWIQSMGPIARVEDYKRIEIGSGGSLQQRRWPPERIADTPEEALDRMFMLPGARYNGPLFSWLNEVPPASIGFMTGSGLGSEYDGDLFMGAATTRSVGGFLFRFKLTPDRTDLDVPHRVAENPVKHDLTGSEFLLFGRNFGIGTDIQTAPNGNLYVVSLTNGAIYEIFQK